MKSIILTCANSDAIVLLKSAGVILELVSGEDVWWTAAVVHQLLWKINTMFPPFRPFFLLCSFSTCSPCCQRLIPNWQTLWGNSFLSEAPSRSVFSTHPDSHCCFFCSGFFFFLPLQRSCLKSCLLHGFPMGRLDKVFTPSQVTNLTKFPKI